MDIEELKFIITQGEGYKLEFKESFSDSTGRFYMRYGANSQQLKRDEIRDFSREENLISFDDIINKEFDLNNDFDEEKFNHFIKITKISPVIRREKIPDKKEFDQDIVSNYYHSIKYLMSHLNTEFIIKGDPREEKLELPEEALREAVLNAIAHRDYFSTANIHINIYKNRVEIINPGGLIGNLS